MKKLKILITAISIFVGTQIIFANNSEAGMSCKYDWLGNYVCTGTGNDTGFNSTTKKDWLGNDVTNYNNYSTGQSGTYSCRYDWLGNYVCN